VTSFCCFPFVLSALGLETLLKLLPLYTSEFLVNRSTLDTYVAILYSKEILSNPSVNLLPGPCLMSWSQWGGKSRFCLGFKFPTSWVL
jgi:hypothetical protein